MRYAVVILMCFAVIFHSFYVLGLATGVMASILFHKFYGSFDE